jgi:PD-(D/E)XK endonuclease
MRKTGNFATCKRRGEWVVLIFMMRAAELEFNVSKPWGDSSRYDVSVEDEGRFRRVQVKSTDVPRGD